MIEENPENTNFTEDAGSRTSPLFFTSMIFITNVITALYKNDFPYALLFAFLTVTSLIVHSYDNVYVNILDKIVIVFIAIYGAHLLWSKYNNIDFIIVACIVVTFLFCIWVYLYGYVRSQYCFHQEECIANKYHCLMHFIGSLGHHCIIFL